MNCSQRLVMKYDEMAVNQFNVSAFIVTNYANYVALQVHCYY